MNIYKEFIKLNPADRSAFINQLSRYDDPIREGLRMISGNWWFKYMIEKKLKLKDIKSFVDENKDNLTITYLKENGEVAYVYHTEDLVATIDYEPDNNKSDDIRFFIKDEKVGIEAVKSFMDKHTKEFKPKSKYFIKLLQHSQRDGYFLNKYNIADMDNLDLISNYNDGFIDIHNKVLNTLITSTKSMTIFHGLPGCGKTTYLRYLVSELANKKKNVVYLPPNVTQLLSNPDFVSSLELFKGSIVIIEDAEGVLVKNGNRSQAISNILNITDGILADIFNIHFIFTFNVDVKEIDPALLRKGRLNLKYEFKSLSEDKVRILCEKIGSTVTTASTLAEIYNSAENIIDKKEEKTLGFMR